MLFRFLHPFLASVSCKAVDSGGKALDEHLMFTVAHSRNVEKSVLQ